MTMAKGTHLEQDGALVVAKVQADKMTHQDAVELTDSLTEKLRFDGATRFVLNLEKVEFLSSACLGTLVNFLQDLEHVHGRIALANCQNDVAFLFKVTRLDSAFLMYDELDDACKAMKA